MPRIPNMQHRAPSCHPALKTSVVHYGEWGRGYWWGTIKNLGSGRRSIDHSLSQRWCLSGSLIPHERKHRSSWLSMAVISVVALSKWWNEFTLVSQSVSPSEKRFDFTRTMPWVCHHCGCLEVLWLLFSSQCPAEFICRLASFLWFTGSSEEHRDGKGLLEDLGNGQTSKEL